MVDPAAFLRETRSRLGLSQEELGSYTGDSKQTISNYERGERMPPIEFWTTIEKALSVDTSEVLSFFYSTGKTRRRGLADDVLSAIRGRIQRVLLIGFDKNQEKMAKACGIHADTIRKILQGNLWLITPTLIRKIERGSGAPYDWLLTGKGDLYTRDMLPKEIETGAYEGKEIGAPTPTGESSTGEPANGLVTNEPGERVFSSVGASNDLFGDRMQLAFYTEVRASAGSGQIIYDERSRSLIELPRLFLMRLIGFQPPQQLGVMSIEGDSMRPTLEDGDMVLYSPAERVAGGGVYVILLDEYLVAKRVERIPGGGYHIISDNKFAGYHDSMLVPNDIGQLVHKDTGRVVDMRVVGRVLWPRRDTDRLHVKQVAELIRGLTGREAYAQI